MVDTEKLKQGTDLRDLAAGLVTLRRESASESSGPCPKCGGSDRFHVTPQFAFCRQCWPPESTTPAHDAIGFVQWAGLAGDFRSAIEYLGGGATGAAVHPLRAADPKAKRVTWRDASWQTAAQREVRAAQRLLASPAGRPGADYLRGRGLSREAWEAWGLGYADTWDPRLKACRPAIVIPWQRQRITAVKYRFLDVPDGGLRYVSRSGSECIAFGMNMAGGHFSTLWLLEGELNAISLWQALCAAHCVNFDVVSFGGDAKAAHLDPVVQSWAARYLRVIVWADNGNKASAAMAGIPGALGLRSTEVDGRKLDASALLELGGLAEFIASVLGRLDADAGFAQRLRAAMESAA